MNRRPDEIDLAEVAPDNAEHNGIQHYARSGGTETAFAICKGYVKRINRDLVVFKDLYLAFASPEDENYTHEYLESDAELWMTEEEHAQFKELNVKKGNAVSFTAKAFGFRKRSEYDYALKEPSNVELLEELEFDEEGIIQRQREYFINKMAMDDHIKEEDREEFKQLMDDKLSQIEELQNMSAMEQAAFMFKVQEQAAIRHLEQEAAAKAEQAVKEDSPETPAETSEE